MKLLLLILVLVFTCGCNDPFTSTNSYEVIITDGVLAPVSYAGPLYFRIFDGCIIGLSHGPKDDKLIVQWIVRELGAEAELNYFGPRTDKVMHLFIHSYEKDNWDRHSGTFHATLSY